MRFRPVVGAILSPLLLASAARGEVVERILAVVGDRPLMLSEASRLAQSVVSEEDEQRAYESLLQRVPSASVLPESDLRRVVRRQAAILTYVEYRFRPQVQVADAAVRDAYEKEYGSRADAPSFEAAAPGIRRQLADRELDEKIEGWVKELRAGAEIRYNP
jgi:hypothetical protein